MAETVADPIIVFLVRIVETEQGLIIMGPGIEDSHGRLDTSDREGTDVVDFRISGSFLTWIPNSNGSLEAIRSAIMALRGRAFTI